MREQVMKYGARFGIALMVAAFGLVSGFALRASVMPDVVHAVPDCNDTKCFLDYASGLHSCVAQLGQDCTIEADHTCTLESCGE